MQDIFPLTSLRPGGRAVVCGLSAGSDMRRRFQELGLIDGSVIVCLTRSPLGDPTAYEIQGAVIALRKEDAAGIQVRKELS